MHRRGHESRNDTVSMLAIPTSLVTSTIPTSLVISSERSESRDLTLASINSQDPSTRSARSG
ncbi:MAG: hypothetical protein ABF770_02125 [Bifidobacterium aquikefiri]|uniref:hypothetical protein n=1 Tax=Bifidobacterium aquikefiri TaxID=1653207 RepID=UPI00130321F7|nr:hypothetical protein [Bifidobacterium aquikefiri]